tara:strand:- start:609 stop:938 length:330 start_codon:yes stop_codon:yes gene_type:complete
MVKLLKIIPAKSKGKKWTAYFMLDNGKEKVISFGQAGAKDFILMNDKTSTHYEPDKKKRDKIKAAYQARHAKDKINEPMTPGSLSWFILWTSPSFGGSIRNFKKKFKLN